ncbi:hypothetical protein TNCV_3567731 [Trichonephila clavipes]|nr:hypothetical protein TNCV_3567731 [Trichonephila clavipes]
MAGNACRKSPDSSRTSPSKAEPASSASTGNENPDAGLEREAIRPNSGNMGFSLPSPRLTSSTPALTSSAARENENPDARLEAIRPGNIRQVTGVSVIRFQILFLRPERTLCPLLAPVRM